MDIPLQDQNRRLGADNAAGGGANDLAGRALVLGFLLGIRAQTIDDFERADTLTRPPRKVTLDLHWKLY